MQQEALKDTRPEPGGSHRCPQSEKRQGLEFILLYVKSVQSQSVMGETRIVVSSRFCVCSSIYSEEFEGTWGVHFREGAGYILYVDLEVCVKQLFRRALMPQG